MKLCGWRARSMFDRYNVIDEHDLAVAVAKRFAKGKVRQSEEAPATSSDSLTSSGTTTPL